jgi:hypothetical protein
VPSPSGPVLVRGMIVWAWTVDSAGCNPKSRPAVLLFSEDEVPPGEPLPAIAITGTLPKPLPSDYVELPWHRSRHPRTGLNKRCAAVCGWKMLVTPGDEVRILGRVPDSLFQEICSKVQAMHPLPPSPPAPPQAP